jgi:hypothetical protein
MLAGLNPVVIKRLEVRTAENVLTCLMSYVDV